MTKNQLIKKLQKIPGDPTIILSSDQEGNSYSIFDEISAPPGLKYKLEGGQVEITESEDIDEYFTQEEYNKAKSCIIFYP